DARHEPDAFRVARTLALAVRVATADPARPERPADRPGARGEARPRRGPSASSWKIAGAVGVVGPRQQRDSEGPGRAGRYRCAPSGRAGWGRGARGLVFEHRPPRVRMAGARR